MSCVAAAVNPVVTAIIIRGGSRI